MLSISSYRYILFVFNIDSNYKTVCQTFENDTGKIAIENSFCKNTKYIAVLLLNRIGEPSRKSIALEWGLDYVFLKECL